MEKTLVAGPWIGELGWELFCWQGYLRKIAPEFHKVTIVCRKGHEFLYKDFADQFITFEVPPDLSANMWMCEGFDMQQVLDGIRETYTHNMLPYNIGFNFNPATGKINSEKNSSFYNQKFITYTSDSRTDHFDIIIHPRNKMQGRDRNWDQHNWQHLVDLLKNHYTIAAIGNNESFELNDVASYRNVSIGDTVAIMNRCRLVAGQSSGPLHLAALSGARHFVWSENVNKDRWENFWNPLQTSCIFYGDKGYNPSVEDIYRQINKAMNKRGSFWRLLFKN